MDAQIGDTVTITTAQHKYHGVIMPSRDGNIVLKLKSGYNIGILTENVKSITVEKKKEKEAENNKSAADTKENAIQDTHLPQISLLHTGGTIASKVDYTTGGVVAQFSPEEIIALYPELADVVQIKSKLVSNILSENLTFAHIETIATAILAEIEESKKNNTQLQGIVVTHGTDTMAYTAAALSFMLQNISIPVVLVGSQRSSDRGSSDAAMNMICAAQFAGHSSIPGVYVCMHHVSSDTICAILPGCKVKKMHSSRRDAFRAINDTAIALISYPERQIEFVHEEAISAAQKRASVAFTAQTVLEKKVGLLKAYPQMNPALLTAFKGYKGLVIEGTGLGHVPIMSVDDDSSHNNDVKKALVALIESGTVVVMTTQTVYGAVQMHVYSCGRELLDLGVISCRMTPEAAMMKLAWLLAQEKDGKRLSAEEITATMQADLCHDTFAFIPEGAFLN